MTPLFLSLAGSCLGLLAALAVARLFQWVRDRAPDPVSYAGNGLAILAGCFGICFFIMAPFLLLPHLLCAAIVWCQWRQPSKSALSWVQLLGITVIEMLTAVLVLWQMNMMITLLGSEPDSLTPVAHPSILLGNANLAFVLVLVLLETAGPPRWREMLGRG